MKKLLSGITLVPLMLGMLAVGCEIEVGKDDSKIATWVGWPANGAREDADSTIFRFTFTEPVKNLKVEDITIDEGGASGYAEKTNASVRPDATADPTGKVWLLEGLTPKQEGLAKVTIDNGDIEKTLHGVPVFKQIDRVPYTVEKKPQTGETKYLILNFAEKGFPYSTYLGDDIIPEVKDIYLEGDAIITGERSTDGTSITIPIEVTKYQGGEVTVYISRAGIEKTNPTSKKGIAYPGGQDTNDHYVSGLVGREAVLEKVEANGGTNESTTELVFTFDKSVDLSNTALKRAGTTPGVLLNASSGVLGVITIPDITLNANNVYSEQGFTGGGRKWRLPVLNITTHGNVDISFVSGNTLGIKPNTPPIRVNISKSRALWTVEGLNSNSQNPQYSDPYEDTRTTTKLKFTFSDMTASLTAADVTLGNGATKGTFTGNILSISNPVEGLLKVTVKTNATVYGGTQDIQIYAKRPEPDPVTPPPSASHPNPPAVTPEPTDPFDAGYPIGINPAGKNLQVEIYKKGYSINQEGTGKYFPFGDNTREQVISHNNWYEVQIAPVGNTDESKWKKITTSPQVSASGVLGQYYCVYWPVTASARSGMGKIIVRVRARPSNNPSGTQWAPWHVFNNSGRGW